MGKYGLKIVRLATIVCGLITCVCSVGRLVLPYMLRVGALNEGNAVGVIGGADGPTAIYMASSSSKLSYTLLFGILTAIGWVILKISEQKNK